MGRLRRAAAYFAASAAAFRVSRPTARTSASRCLTLWATAACEQHGFWSRAYAAACRSRRYVSCPRSLVPVDGQMRISCSDCRFPVPTLLTVYRVATVARNRVTSAAMAARHAAQECVTSHSSSVAVSFAACVRAYRARAAAIISSASATISDKFSSRPAGAFFAASAAACRSLLMARNVWMDAVSRTAGAAA